jgi:RHS repeat-associated protein
MAPRTHSNPTAPPALGTLPPSSSKSNDNPTKPWSVGHGVPGFRTSFDVSGKGGGAFRDVSEKFAVNPANGSLSLSLPISVSPSRGGFQPELHLAYLSGAGNGPFGFGWSMSIPVVGRNTTRGIPRYEDDDYDITLSGADIVRTLLKDGSLASLRSCEGFDITSFQYRIDSDNTLIERWTARNDCANVHWRTTSSTNVTKIYGDGDNSRVFDQVGSHKNVFQWLLSRSYDSYGNAMEYVYKAENDEGVRDDAGRFPQHESGRSPLARTCARYLKTIRYGNRTPNRDLDTWEATNWPTDWMFEVLFDYGEHSNAARPSEPQLPWAKRRDAFSSCNAGFEIRRYRLCRRILNIHHLPELEGGADSLVASTIFDYDDQPQRTVLSKVTMQGHDPDGVTTPLPPWSFEYTGVPKATAVQSMTANVSTLTNIPSSDSTLTSEWLDLDGDGIPGLLTKLPGGALVYQRHSPQSQEVHSICEPLYRPMEYLQTHPNAVEGVMEDIEANGKLYFVCEDQSGARVGHYSRKANASWGDYTTFPVVSTVSKLPTSEPISIDLTGDGRTDRILALSDSVLVWQQNLGLQGMSEHKRVYIGPEGLSSRSSNKHKLTVADMTGDGLGDLVEVNHSTVTYWPNHGYGRFGSAVRMSNCPFLDSWSDFDPVRVRLIDVDGNGTADLLFLLESGGAELYHNLAGNAWSKAIFIPFLPAATPLSSIFALDILGKGYSCLCWAEPSSSSGQLSIKFVDLMGGRKPHLLECYDNGLGCNTRVAHEPSTTFSQHDELEGLTWTTKLPFPVQCVSSVEIIDHTTGNTCTSKYKYHNGTYDHVEREFAGFEMVEHRFSECLILGPGTVYETIPTLTRTWYSTGQGPTVDQRKFFSQAEVFSLADCTNASPSEAYHALRGAKVRSETFVEDDGLPLVVEEFSYDVHELQPAKLNGFASSRITLRATLKAQYNGVVEDPRRTHQIVLRTNDFSDIEDELIVVYPRKSAYVSGLERDGEGAKLQGNALVAANQRAGNVTWKKQVFTNVVHEWPYFHRPMLCGKRDMEILGLSLTNLLDVDEMRQRNLMADTTSSPSHRLRSASRMLYFDRNLQTPLDMGLLEPFSVLERTYALAYTPGLLSQLQEGRDRCGAESSIEQILLDGRYVQMKGDDDGTWWLPSHTALFGAETHRSSARSDARSSFYVPTRTRDVFGNVTTLELDCNRLLAQKQVDAVGNTMDFSNNYHFLQPTSLTDSNGNDTMCKLDALGRIIAKGVVSKANSYEPQADSLQGCKLDVTSDEIESVLRNPTGSCAREVLGRCASRTVYMLKTPSGQEHDFQPHYTVEISRDLAFGQDAQSKIHMVVTHFDGLGRPAQIATLADTDNEQNRWQILREPLHDWQGHLIQQYWPWYASTPAYIKPQDIQSCGEMMIYDAMGREVVKLYANHTWTKTVIGSWTIAHYGVEHSLECEDPASDPDVGRYFAMVKTQTSYVPWAKYQLAKAGMAQISVSKSLAYIITPIVTHMGSCGLPLLEWHNVVGHTIEGPKTMTYMTRMEYDFAGNRIASYDSRGTCIEKCLFDKLQRKLHTFSMDSGEQWTLQDAGGSELVSWNSRGVEYYRTYDCLRRETGKWLQKSARQRQLIVQTLYGEEKKDASAENLKTRVWQVKDQSGIHVNEGFDLRGNCTRRSLQLAREYKTVIDWAVSVPLESEVLSKESTYNHYGWIIGEQDSRSNSLRTTYDRLGKHHAVEYRTSKDGVWQSIQDATSYSADGLLLRQDRGNGTSTLYSYDEDTRLLTRQTTLRLKGRVKTVLEDLVFTYDCNGRKIHTVDKSEDTTSFRNCTVAPIWEYTYDAIGQLTSATGRGLLPDAPGQGVQLRPHRATSGMSTIGGTAKQRSYQYLESYQYDLAGNMLSLQHQALQDTTISGWTQRYAYEEPSLLVKGELNNRLTKTTIGKKDPEYYEYNATGCTTKLSPYSRRLEWTADNLLSVSAQQRVNVGTPESTYYVYNHEGDRIRKITESASTPSSGPPHKMSETIYAFSLQIQTKFNNDGSSAGLSATRFTIKAAEKLAVVERTVKGLLFRYLIGSNMETDDEGNLICYEEYTPFGQIMYTSVRQDIEASSVYRYARYEFDAESGLYHCGARYYCPWLNRWLSPDPIGLEDGPNRYCYVKNDPINSRDHSGLSRQPFWGGMQPFVNMLQGKTLSQNLNKGAQIQDQIQEKGMDKFRDIMNKNKQEILQNGDSLATSATHAREKAKVVVEVNNTLGRHINPKGPLGVVAKLVLPIVSAKLVDMGDNALKTVAPQFFPDGRNSKAAEAAYDAKGILARTGKEKSLDWFQKGVDALQLGKTLTGAPPQVSDKVEAVQEKSHGSQEPVGPQQRCDQSWLSKMTGKF